jgi:hypothetical protein
VRELSQNSYQLSECIGSLQNHCRKLDTSSLVYLLVRTKIESQINTETETLKSHNQKLNLEICHPEMLLNMYVLI